MDPSSPGPLVVEGGLAEEAGPPPAGAAVVV
ncbi:MAG: hypothetical protein QOK40_1390, partial [Miltoncostaeaceae bacterium]|nr:hypothetical protein [Miltoncostaeaceae bacterium]